MFSKARQYSRGDNGNGYVYSHLKQYQYSPRKALVCKETKCLHQARNSVTTDGPIVTLEILGYRLQMVTRPLSPKVFGRS